MACCGNEFSLPKSGSVTLTIGILIPTTSMEYNRFLVKVELVLNQWMGAILQWVPYSSSASMDLAPTPPIQTIQTCPATERVLTALMALGSVTRAKVSKRRMNIALLWLVGGVWGWFGPCDGPCVSIGCRCQSHQDAMIITCLCLQTRHWESREFEIMMRS